MTRTHKAKLWLNRVFVCSLKGHDPAYFNGCADGGLDLGETWCERCWVHVDHSGKPWGNRSQNYKKTVASMNRRGFIASLFAPLVAKLFPKPVKSIYNLGPLSFGGHSIVVNSAVPKNEIWVINPKDWLPEIIEIGWTGGPYTGLRFDELGKDDCGPGSGTFTRLVTRNGLIKAKQLYPTMTIWDRELGYEGTDAVLRRMADNFSRPAVNV